MAKIKELRDTLKAEAKDLMEKVHTLNFKKNDGGDSVAVGQVRQLQLEISELEQEVRGASASWGGFFNSFANVKMEPGTQGEMETINR